MIQRPARFLGIIALSASFSTPVLAEDGDEGEVVDLDADQEEESDDVLGEDDEMGFDSEDAEEGASSGGSSVELSPLDFTLGVGAISRFLRYSENSAGLPAAPNDNTLPAAAFASLSGHWYFIDYLGVDFAFARSLSKKTKYADDELKSDEIYKASYQAFSGGLRGRFPISILTLGVEANYGREYVWVRAVDDSEDGGLEADPQKFPDVNYSYLEGRLDAAVTVNQLSLMGYFGYRKGLTVGEIGDAPETNAAGLQTDPGWFENAKAMALTYGLEFGYRLSPSWQIVAGIDATSYALNFNTVEPGSNRIAGGASDFFLSVLGGLRWNLPGSGGDEAAGGSGETEAESESDGSGFDSFD